MAQFTLEGYSSWDMPVYMHRTNPVPLDSSSVFTSLSDAETYAAGKLSYDSQIIGVVTGEGSDTVVDLYYIQNKALYSLAGSGSAGDPWETYE